jgi:hypothetical protein
MTLLDGVKRAVAYLLSFRKKEWTLEDYPIRYRRQKGDLPQLKPWIARIPGWWVMTGLGDSREEALADLRRSVEEHRERHGALPRPGTDVPIEFAPFEVVSRHEDLAAEFFPPIIGMSYDDCLITDESSVWDFAVMGDAGELARKVRLVFGTDISDLAAEGNIAAILDRIAAHRRGG